MIELLLSERFVSHTMWILFVGCPLVALLAVLFMPSRRSAFLRAPLFWALAGSGPFVACLWFVFNLVENVLGLDSFPALLINLVLFCVVGALLGVWLRSSGLVGKQSRPARADENPKGD